MADASELSLDAATPDDALLLGNLLELSVHDLSDVFPNLAAGPHGRFGYPGSAASAHRGELTLPATSSL